MASQWDWWRSALAKEPGSIPDGMPESGFYKMKASKAGGWSPVAVWRDDGGKFYCRVGIREEHRLLTERQAENKWTFFCAGAVTRDAYMAAYESGIWVDGSPTQAPKTNVHDDPYAAWKAEVDDKLNGVGDWLAKDAVDTKVKADRARNTQSEILALIKRGEGMHKEEKAPVLKLTAEVDGKYLPKCKDAKATADKLRQLYRAFAVAEEDRLRKEAQAAFEAEQKRVAVERANIEAEQAKLMRDDPIAALTSPEPKLPVAPVAPTPIKVNIGGGVGRAAGLKDEWFAVVTDYKAAALHFIDHPDVKAVVDKLAKAAAKASKQATKIPGVEAQSRRVAA